jgi:hypothetical protein
VKIQPQWVVTAGKQTTIYQNTYKIAMICKGTGQAIQLQAWTGSQISRQSVYEGDKFFSLTHRPIRRTMIFRWKF